MFPRTASGRACRRRLAVACLLPRQGRTSRPWHPPRKSRKTKSDDERKPHLSRWPVARGTRRPVVRRDAKMYGEAGLVGGPSGGWWRVKWLPENHLRRRASRFPPLRALCADTSFWPAAQVALQKRLTTKVCEVVEQRFDQPKNGLPDGVASRCGEMTNAKSASWTNTPSPSVVSDQLPKKIFLFSFVPIHGRNH